MGGAPSPPGLNLTFAFLNIMIIINNAYLIKS